MGRSRSKRKSRGRLGRGLRIQSDDERSSTSEEEWIDEEPISPRRRVESAHGKPIDSLEKHAKMLDRLYVKHGPDEFRDMFLTDSHTRNNESDRFVAREARVSSEQRVMDENVAADRLLRKEERKMERFGNHERFGIHNLHDEGDPNIDDYTKRSGMSDFQAGLYKFLVKNKKNVQQMVGSEEEVSHDAATVNGASLDSIEIGRGLEVDVAASIDDFDADDSIEDEEEEHDESSCDCCDFAIDPDESVKDGDSSVPSDGGSVLTQPRHKDDGSSTYGGEYEGEGEESVGACNDEQSVASRFSTEPDFEWSGLIDADAENQSYSYDGWGAHEDEVEEADLAGDNSPHADRFSTQPEFEWSGVLDEDAENQSFPYDGSDAHEDEVEEAELAGDNIPHADPEDANQDDDTEDYEDAGGRVQNEGGSIDSAIVGCEISGQLGVEEDASPSSPLMKLLADCESSPHSTYEGDRLVSPREVKPKLKIGDYVWAKYTNGEVEGSLDWYRGYILCNEEQPGPSSRYGPCFKYNVKFDDGDEGCHLSEEHVMKEDDYLLLTDDDLNLSRSRENLIHTVFDHDNDDQWASVIGFYTTMVGGQRRAYPSLCQAIFARDAKLIANSYPNICLKKLVLPQMWSEVLGHKTSLTSNLCLTKFFSNRRSATKKKNTKTSKTRRKQCGVCFGCVKDDCGACKYCKDMLKFGGKGTMKKKCMNRSCEKMK